MNNVTPTTPSVFEAPDAVKAIRLSRADAAIKLSAEFLIQTACRSEEVLHAELREIDIDNATWTIPAWRSKSGRSHQVALSSGSLRVLDEAGEIEGRDSSSLVFPSPMGGALSAEELAGLFRRLNINNFHGVRFAFRAWCEVSNVRFELAAAALGHTPPGTLFAFVRSTFLKRQVPLMQAWADYLSGDLADDWRWCEPL